MNDTVEILKTALLLLISLFVGVVAYLGRRTSERVDTLKETAVTRDELTAALDRIEARQLSRHGENRDVLERIETKIDSNEERASKTRHDTKDEVHALAMQLAVLSRNHRQ